MPRKSSSIRLTGVAANMFMAHATVDSYGSKAHHNCVVDGPFYNACMAVMKERGITPEPIPQSNSKEGQPS